MSSIKRLSFPIYIMMTVVMPASLIAADTGQARVDDTTSSTLVATEMPKSNVELFEDWRGSNFAMFFRDKTVDFSQYDGIIFFPTTFDRMVFSKNTTPELRKSWRNTTFREMDSICEDFDFFAERKFKSSEYVKPTKRGGKNVLAIEFRFKEFKPVSARLDDLGTRSNIRNRTGVGTLTYQAVIVESQTGRLVGVIEDRMEIRSNFFTSDSRVNRNLAWRKAFKSVIDKLHSDFVELNKTV